MYDDVSVKVVLIHTSCNRVLDVLEARKEVVASIYGDKMLCSWYANGATVS